MSANPNEQTPPPASPVTETPDSDAGEANATRKRPREIGGPKGPEPTRYGDWEFNGRCTDF